MQAREPITSDHTCTVMTLRKSQSCALRTKYSHQTNIKFDELCSLIYKNITISHLLGKVGIISGGEWGQY